MRKYAFQSTQSKTIVEIHLIDFRNPGSKDYDSKCCDTFCPFIQCDNWFQFCFKANPNQACVYAANTYVLFDDDANFKLLTSIGDKLHNPFNFEFNGPFVSPFHFQIYF